MQALELGGRLLLSAAQLQPGGVPVDAQHQFDPNNTLPTSAYVENVAMPSHMSGDLTITVFAQEAPASPIPSAEPAPSVEPTDPCDDEPDGIAVAVNEPIASPQAGSSPEPSPIYVAGGDSSVMGEEETTEDEGTDEDCAQPTPTPDRTPYTPAGVATGLEIDRVQEEIKEIDTIKYGELKADAEEIWDQYGDQLDDFAYPEDPTYGVTRKNFMGFLKIVDIGDKSTRNQVRGFKDKKEAQHLIDLSRISLAAGYLITTLYLSVKTSDPALKLELQNHAALLYMYGVTEFGRKDFDKQINSSQANPYILPQY